MVDRAQREAEKKKSAEWEQATRAIRQEMETLLDDARGSLTEDEFFKFPESIKLPSPRMPTSARRTNCRWRTVPA